MCQLAPLSYALSPCSGSSLSTLSAQPRIPTPSLTFPTNPVPVPNPAPVPAAPIGLRALDQRIHRLSETTRVGDALLVRAFLCCPGLRMTAVFRSGLLCSMAVEHVTGQRYRVQEARLRCRHLVDTAAAASVGLARCRPCGASRNGAPPSCPPLALPRSRHVTHHASSLSPRKKIAKKMYHIYHGLVTSFHFPLHFLLSFTYPSHLGIPRTQ